jgi:uncharacterized protein (TIGR00730 family)
VNRETGQNPVEADPALMGGLERIDELYCHTADSRGDGTPGMNSICVFCGSSPGRDRRYEDAARATARALAHAKLRLVYGGGKVGLMGTLADELLSAGGRVTGIIPRSLWEKEIAHDGLTELRVVEDMHERKKLMAELSDGFIALPGGAGTLEEIFEQWTWSQLGIHTKPCGLLNVDGYFNLQIAMIERMVGEGFLSHAYAAMLQVESDPNVLLARMRVYRPPARKWSGNDGRRTPSRSIPIAAAVIADEDGRVLLVRKSHTSFFMQPGGKLSAGETAIEALRRELKEELGCLLVKSEFLGFFAAPAANEPMHSVEAALFQVFTSGQLEPQAEIEEIAWVDPAASSGWPLAPLTRDHVFPLLLLRRSGWSEPPTKLP